MSIIIETEFNKYVGHVLKVEDKYRKLGTILDSFDMNSDDESIHAKEFEGTESDFLGKSEYEFTRSCTEAHLETFLAKHFSLSCVIYFWQLHCVHWLQIHLLLEMCGVKGAAESWKTPQKF